MDHLDRIIKTLQDYQKANRPPAVEEPANAFEELVNDHDEMRLLIAKVKAALKPLEADERQMRDGIAESLRVFLADGLKEGMNTYELSNRRKLEFGNKVDRTIEGSMIATARAAYVASEDAPPNLAFDDLLRVKYELAVPNFRKVNGKAGKAVSRMIVTKFAAPTLEVD